MSNLFRVKSICLSYGMSTFFFFFFNNKFITILLVLCDNRLIFRSTFSFPSYMIADMCYGVCSYLLNVNGYIRVLEDFLSVLIIVNKFPRHTPVHKTTSSLLIRLLPDLFTLCSERKV